MQTEVRKISRLQLRKFLATEYGMEIMLNARERIPSVISDESHKMIFSAGRAEGFKDALDYIQSLQLLDESPKDINLENL